MTYVPSGWPRSIDDERLHPYCHRRKEWSVEADCLFWVLQVIIPPKLRDPVLEELHVAHPGVVKMKVVARSHVRWESIDHDIESVVRQCLSCQQT